MPLQIISYTMISKREHTQNIYIRESHTPNTSCSIHNEHNNYGWRERIWAIHSNKDKSYRYNSLCRGQNTTCPLAQDKWLSWQTSKSHLRIWQTLSAAWFCLATDNKLIDWQVILWVELAHCTIATHVFQPQSLVTQKALITQESMEYIIPRLQAFQRTAHAKNTGEIQLNIKPQANITTLNRPEQEVYKWGIITWFMFHYEMFLECVFIISKHFNMHNSQYIKTIVAVLVLNPQTGRHQHYTNSLILFVLWQIEHDFRR